MGNVCFHAPDFACTLNGTAPYNNCTGWGIMCEAHVPSQYQVLPGQWTYDYQCTDQPKRFITAAITFLSTAGGILLLTCCFCRPLRSCASSSKILYFMEAFLNFWFPIAFLGGFTLLGIGYVPYNAHQKLTDLYDICSISMNSKLCRGFQCHYSHAGQAGVIVGIIIGFSVFGVICAAAATPSVKYRSSTRSRPAAPTTTTDADISLDFVSPDMDNSTTDDVPPAATTTNEKNQVPDYQTTVTDRNQASTYNPPPVYPSENPYLQPQESRLDSLLFPPGMDPSQGIYPPRNHVSFYPPPNPSVDDEPPPQYQNNASDA